MNRSISSLSKHLTNRKNVLGVTGGIAAYKSAYLVGLYRIALKRKKELENAKKMLQV